MRKAAGPAKRGVKRGLLVDHRLEDNTAVWLGLATVLTSGGIALLVAGHLVESVIGGLLVASGVILFLLLLFHRPYEPVAEVNHSIRSNGVSLSDVFRGPGHFDDSLSSLPDLPPPPLYESAEAEMHQLAPTSWLIAPDGDSPEVFLRCAAALPGITAARYSGEPATVLRGEAREAFLLEVLTEAPLTQWLRALCREWNCPDNAEWKPHGAGQPDLTQLLFRPSGTRGEPLLARFGVLTGWRVIGTRTVPAIRCVLDILMNISALDSDRHLDRSRSADAPVPRSAPLPASLSPRQLGEYLVALLDVAPLAQVIGKELLPEGDFSKGAIGLWISCSGIQLQNLVDLQGLRRLEGAYDSASEGKVSRWPLTENASSVEAQNRTFVADFLDTVLERGGYRGVKDLFDPLRGAC